ncbi:hypothetical protein F4778DRAFT_784438 [Xylariomycetidae sp. FL2044]|nr:hypothetical protein F4778DRAFT_784438 [Xylariomycetidae sp. FL2044]
MSPFGTSHYAPHEDTKDLPSSCDASSSTICGTVILYEKDGCWRGNLPCVHHTKDGCRIHNPDKLPIIYNARLPNKLETLSLRNRVLPNHLQAPGLRKRVLGVMPRANVTPLEPGEPIWSSLHLDHPIHSSIHYALAYYHLDWAIPVGSSDMDRMLDLHCRGTGVGRPDLKYSITPFWYNDTFLMDQSIVINLGLEKHSPIYKRTSTRMMSTFQWDKYLFKPCQHVHLQFLTHDLIKTRGLLRAWCRYDTQCIHRSTHHSTDHTEWDSRNGNMCRSWICECCPTEIDMWLVAGKSNTVITIEVYRDLGDASSPYHVKWLAALRPDQEMYQYNNPNEPRPVRMMVAAAKKKRKAFLKTNGQRECLTIMEGFLHDYGLGCGKDCCWGYLILLAAGHGKAMHIPVEGQSNNRTVISASTVPNTAVIMG